MSDLASDGITRDLVRDVCLQIAQLAAGCVHLIGTDAAAAVIESVGRLSTRMDELDLNDE